MDERNEKRKRTMSSDNSSRSAFSKRVTQSQARVNSTTSGDDPRSPESASHTANEQAVATGSQSRARSGPACNAQESPIGQESESREIGSLHSPPDAPRGSPAVSRPSSQRSDRGSVASTIEEADDESYRDPDILEVGFSLCEGEARGAVIVGYDSEGSWMATNDVVEFDGEWTLYNFIEDYLTQPKRILVEMTFDVDLSTDLKLERDVDEALCTFLPLLQESLEFEFGFGVSFYNEDRAFEPDPVATREWVIQRFIRLTKGSGFFPSVTHGAEVGHAWRQESDIVVVRFEPQPPSNPT